LFQGLSGSVIYDKNIRRSGRWHEGRNWEKGLLRRWRSPKDPGDGFHRKLTTELDGRVLIGNSNWLTPGGYIRLKHLTLSYGFDQSLINKLGISKLRIYITGVNLFTITNSLVIDPQTHNGSDARSRGTSGNTYPTSKVFSMGVNITF
jgi:hypothetical protein